MPWTHLDLTVAKLPLLVDNERTVYTARNVGLYIGDIKAENYARGWVYLTSQRLCYVDDRLPEEHSIAAPLSKITSVDHVPGFIKSSAKIVIKFGSSAVSSRALENQNPWICPICSFTNQLSKRFVLGVSQLPVCENCGIPASLGVIEAVVQPKPSILERNGGNTTALQTATGIKSVTEGQEYIECPVCTFHNHPYLRVCEVCGTTLSERSIAVDLGPLVKLSFRSGGSREFYEQLQNLTLPDRAPATNGEVQYGTLPGQAGDASLESTASRLESFQIGIHGLQQASHTRQFEGRAALDAATADVNALDTKANELLKMIEAYSRTHPNAVQTLGLESAAISKDMVRDEKAFQQQVSRQVAEFLVGHNLLQKEGGVMSLFEVYSLYNRARGTELVSPSDVNAALAMLEDSGMPIRMHTLRSGLRVIEHKMWKSTHARLTDWVSSLEPWQAAAGVSASDASAKFGWGIHISQEELEVADADGFLCRDDQPGGVRYFPNLILAEPVL